MIYAEIFAEAKNFFVKKMMKERKNLCAMNYFMCCSVNFTNFCDAIL